MIIKDKSQLREEREKVKTQARHVVTKLNKLSGDSLNALYKLKFTEFGFDPLDGTDLNLIEQLNQTFHALAVFAAAEIIFDEFKDCGTLRLSPQIDGGVDIRSVRPNLLAAEVFATVNIKNNNKLYADAKRLNRKEEKADKRFVFFYDPNRSRNPGLQTDLAKNYRPVEVWALSENQIMGRGGTH